MTIRTYNNKTPNIDKSAYIDPASTVIGDVTIGEDSSIWPTAVIRGDMHQIKIGSKTSIQDGTICHITHDGQYSVGGYPLTIGSEVTVGHNAILHGCTIHDKVLIGMGSVVLDGAVIESNVILGAGSLVSPNKVLKSGFLYVGRPAVEKRPLTKKESAFIQYSANNYVKLKNTYLKEL